MSKGDTNVTEKKQLSKLKKVIKKLEVFEDELKDKEKKIDKKLKKSDKLKKSKVKKLKAKSAKSEEKAKKIAAKLLKKKEEARQLKEKAKKLTEPPKASKSAQESDASDTIIDEVFEIEHPLVANKDEEGAKDGSTSISRDFNSKEAIAYVRQLNSEEEIDLFVKNDDRVTVSNAAKSRKNAIAAK
ncbi:MAG: hypothetical protein HC819_08260 [Cyclobacteriaceae bacterium]|nr:hypothetical protein [Cyclobacteriaceae bacterium]